MSFIFSPQKALFYFFEEAVSASLFSHRRHRCQFFSSVHDDADGEATEMSLVFGNFVLTLSTSCFRYYNALPTDPKSTCNRDTPDKWLPRPDTRTASKTAFCYYCFCSSPSRCTKMAKLDNNEDWRGDSGWLFSFLLASFFLFFSSTWRSLKQASFIELKRRLFSFSLSTADFFSRVLGLWLIFDRSFSPDLSR